MGFSFECSSIGLVYAFVHSILISFENVLAKDIHDVHPFEISFFRMFIVLLVATPINLREKKFFGEKEDRVCLFFRGLCGSLLFLTQFYALQYMNLGDVCAIRFSSVPIASMLGCILLKEPCGAFESVMSLLCVTGVIFVTQPSFIFQTASGIKDSSSASNIIAHIFAVAGGCLGPIIPLFLRRLKHVPVATVMCIYSLIGCGLSTVILYIMGLWSVSSKWETWLELFGIGGITLLAQICFTKAARTEHAGVIIIIMTTQIVYHYIWQYFLFNEKINFLTAIGSVLIFIAASSGGVRKLFNSKTEIKPDEIKQTIAGAFDISVEK